MLEYSINNPGSKQTPPSKKINAKAIFVLVLLLFFGAFFLIKNILSNTSDENVLSDTVAPSPPVKLIGSSKELLDKIKLLTPPVGGTYAVYIYDIKSGKELGINDQMIFTAASLNKLAILSVLYQQAAENKIDLDKIIIPQKEDIQNYGTGSIQYDPPNTPYSIKTLAKLMIEQSDNTAAYLLGNVVIGLPQIQKQIEDWGLLQTDMVNNKTSAKDMSVLLKKIYNGEITSKPYTLEMLEFMNKTDFEDRIPTGVPQDVKTYHKTGDEIGKIHDAAIVELPDKPYILVVLSEEITDEDKAKQTIAQISRDVYEFMKK